MSNRIESLDRNFAPIAVSGDLAWYDIRDLGLEGRGFEDVLTPFDRLPGRAQPIVPPGVWFLSQHSAGLCARFVTESTSLSVSWSLRENLQPMPHMTATGQAGLDLYVRVDDQWRRQATAQPIQPRDNQSALINAESPIPAGKREFMLYLPLYSGVRSVSVGVPKGTSIQPAPPRPKERSQPICFYGTSIVQGGCASRPGMAYPAILGRWLDRPTINLGFSGNGKAEAELANLMSEIDASAYVIDTLPNMNLEQVKERMVPFVQILRRHRPATPILLVENITYQRGVPLPDNQTRTQNCNRALHDSFEQLQSAGIDHLHYLPGADLLGDDGEGTVDGTHPTDLGFLRMARTIRPALQAMLDHPPQ
ncbi:MAG: SGNH/GDSL hydrolase family protein [Phycisphaerales bacterium]|nr:SGNH/GDSL hydrolase family protein [Phycisphaerales bacterium]